MKRCPICHTQYDDNQNFCVKDGHELESVTIEMQPSQESQSTEKSYIEQKPNKSGCLKRVVISCVVIIIGLILFYNYLNNATTYLRTEPSAVVISKGGGSCTVDIDYDGYIWNVNHKPEWIEIDENNKDFKLSANSNESGQMREGSITIQSGKILAQVFVRQNAYATKITTSESAVKFGKSGGKREITIESDGCAWVAEYTNWMNVSKESESCLHIDCPRNDGEYRTGTIVVKEDNVLTTINITQSGKCNNCHGTGNVSCNSCFGTGGTGYGMFYTTCMWCGGKGKFECGVCHGTGMRE